MYRTNALLVSVFGLVALIGCAGRSVVVQSQPDKAEVSFLSGTGNRVSLGKTPLTVNDKEFPQVFTQAGAFEVVREGFMPELLVLPHTTLAAEVAVSVALKELKPGDTCSHVAASNLARGIAMAQQQIMGKRFLEAETTLKSLSVAYPNLSVIYDLLGNLYYLQRNIPNAMQAYRRSYELDPGNTYTEKLLGKLRALSSVEN